MASENLKIVVVLGPNAVGKSGLAVHLAKRFGGEIVSADSRQVYKGLDIGTGKVTKREMRGVPHNLLDVANPKKQMTAGQFKKLAHRAIKDITRRGRVPILVGGTGFYIDAVLGNVSFPEVPPDTGLRKALSETPADELLSILKRLDPERAETVDQNNPPRIIRAIEIARALGKVPKLNDKDEHYDALKIGLYLPDRELKAKIEKRVQARFRKGMLAEARRLKRQGVSLKRMKELGLTYRCLAEYLEGTSTKKEMENCTIEAEQRYAKRQMRWFKRDPDIKWYRPDEYPKIEKGVRSFLNR